MDREYWKKDYRDKWPAGKRRAEKIAGLIKSWGFVVEEFGFLTTSTEYVKTSPEEKGKPDWKVDISNKKFILLEATGTGKSRGADDVWIRDDKFEYAERHPEYECWAGHIVESKNLIRFIKLEKKDRFELQKIQIRVEETYRVVPEKTKDLLNETDFKIYLESLKGNGN